ncbi:hypothetical protein J6590_075202, partial [Homalodisca vitripennis]
SVHQYETRTRDKFRSTHHRTVLFSTEISQAGINQSEVNPPGPDRSVHQYETRTRDKFRSTHHRTSEVNPPGPDRSIHQYETKTRDKFRSTHHRTVLFSTEISQAGINQSEVNPPGPDRSVHQYETRTRDKFRSTHHRTVLFSIEISQDNRTDQMNLGSAKNLSSHSGFRFFGRFSWPLIIKLEFEE